MVKFDYLYLSDRGLWQDVDILLRTAARVFTRAGQ
jgi:lipopolysaccharide/colanic/teichoic acid biosynthesis glycosyltransferase